MKAKENKTETIVIRVTPTEKALLEKRSGRFSLSRFVRDQALSEEVQLEPAIQKQLLKRAACANQTPAEYLTQVFAFFSMH